MSNHSSTSTTTMPSSTPPASPRYVFHTSPAAPPTKKSRSTSSPNSSQDQQQQQQQQQQNTSRHNGESSSSRRAELQKLMKGSSSNSTDGLLNLARSQLSPPSPSPPPSNGNGHLSPPPIPLAPLRSNTPPSSMNGRPPRSRSPPPMNRHTPPPIIPPSQPRQISPLTAAHQAPPSHRHTPAHNKASVAIPPPPKSAPPALLNYLNADDSSVISTQSQTTRRSADDTTSPRPPSSSSSDKPPVAPSAVLRLTHKLRDVQEEKTKALEEKSRALERIALLESQLAKKGEGEERRKALVFLVWITERTVRRNILRRAFRVLSRDKMKIKPHSPPTLLTRTLSASAITPLRPSHTPLSTPSSSRHINAPLHPPLRPRPSPTTPSASSLEVTHLAEAARCTPTMYQSSLATYHVRPPFVPPNKEDGSVWKNHDEMTTEGYIGTADPMSPETVDVMVVLAEGSVWILRRNDDFVDDQGGRVDLTYIDARGMEREYPLGEIYEEAQMTRNSYCSSLMAAAAALQAANTVISSSASPALTTQRDTLVPPPPSTTNTNDAAAATMKTEITSPNTTPSEDAVPTAVPSSETTTTTSSHKTIDQPTKTAVAPDDVFFSLLGQLLSLIFRILVTLFWTIPFRLVVFGLYVGIMFAFVGGVWMLLADDHGAMMMGATGVTDRYAIVY